jgi:uncharacterized protein (TIGR02757 family)
MRPELIEGLHRLRQRPAREGWLQGDPLSFVHRYPRPEDAELVAAIAGGLAFGRVASFFPVVEALLAEAERWGGPRAWVEGFDAPRAAALAPFYYRWLDGRDLALYIAALGRAAREHGRLGALWESCSQIERPGAALTGAIAALRGLAADEGQRLGLLAADEPLPRGLLNLLSSPADGSACKRWCLILRWMVRDELPDLGLWRLPPRALVIPLDTHVHQLSLLLGLTTRKDSSWRTALQITQALRAVRPEDPLGLDFALAHLGISGACRKQHCAEICGACELREACPAGYPPRPDPG